MPNCDFYALAEEPGEKLRQFHATQELADAGLLTMKRSQHKAGVGFSFG